MIYLTRTNLMKGMSADVKAIFAKHKKDAIQRIGPEILALVRWNVIASGVKDDRGRIATWQDSALGSLGGYAAVRAVANGKWDLRGSSPGAITNYLESGHKVRYPSGKSKRYKPTATREKTTAFGFYKSSQADAARMAETYARELEQTIAKAVETEMGG